MSSTVVHTRVDADMAEDLATISKRLGVSVSDLVREGLEREIPPLRASLGIPPRESTTQETP